LRRIKGLGPRIWMWPKTSPTNKYNEILSESLELEGFKVENFRWRKALKIKKGDILYFHWIHYDYQHKNILIMIIKSMILISYFVYLKMIKVKLIWTLHNLYPHKYLYKGLERIIRNIVLLLTNRILVASSSIKLDVLKEYKFIKEKKIMVVKHGNYKGAYPEKQIDFREKYCIDKNQTVYLFFGAIKQYKGVINLIEVFKEVSNENDKLIIAGQPDEEMRIKLKDYLEEDNDRIIFDLRFIPDDELVPLIRASDFIVLPFEAITTSGSAILAASYEKIIITVNNPTFKEYFTPRMAIFYNHHSELKEAIILSHEFQKDKNDYKKFLEETSWEKIRKQIAGIIRE
jgi:beta-1,4-mannosyltransferase